MTPATTVQPRDDGRLADQLSQARRAAADAERSSGQVSTRTDQEGAQQTTISRDGKQTIIQTDKNGVTRITNEDGQVTVIDPQAIAAQAAQAAQAAVGTTQPPRMPRFPGESGPPDSVIRLVTIVMTILAIMLIGFPIARAFARRVDRKPVGGSPDPEVGRRLDRIEQAIEAVAEEVERVSEAQRYSAKLLTERLPETPARAIAGADQMSR
jgi:hypothetical protein